MDRLIKWSVKTSQNTIEGEEINRNKTQNHTENNTENNKTNE